MAIVESKTSCPDVTSTAKMADVVSKKDFNPTSKTEFNPVSKYEGPLPTSTYNNGLNPMMAIAERNAMMFPADDITMAEIVAECKAVRQELYEKRLSEQHGN